MIKLILKKKVQNLGLAGDVVQVKSGYARNFLIPHGFAIFLKSHDEKILAHHKKVLDKKIKEESLENLDLKSKIEMLEISFVRKTVPGQSRLFGAITNQDLWSELTKKDLHIERNKIALGNPIKETGSYTAPVKISKDITAVLKFSVLPEVIEEIVVKAEQQEEIVEISPKKTTKKVLKK